MKKKNGLFSLMLCVSIIIHAVVFFTVSVYPTGGNGVPGPTRALPVFSLVNITPLEPNIPEPSPPAPPLSVELPPTLPPEPPDTPAENFIPREPMPEDAETAAPPEAEELSGPAEDTDPEADAEAATADYVKRNYSYIQRRIWGKLEYPLLALRAGAQGVVEVSFTLNEDGGVSDVSIVKTSGSEALDNAAMEAIHAAAPFRPPPAAVRMVIPVAFRLQ
jgi:protein TonB